MAATLPTMKKLREELSRRPLLVRVLGLLMLSCLCFYVGKRWATKYEEIVVYGGTSPSSPTEFHVSIVDVGETQEAAGGNGSVVDPRNPAPGSDPRNPAPDSVPLPPPPPEMLVSPSGILQEDGSIVTTEFPMDEPAPSIEDDALDLSSQNNSSASPRGGSGKPKKLKFKVCPPRMKEYIPCLDNVAAIKQLPSTKKGEKWERHCPQREGDLLNCLIPAPRAYRYPIRWPKSRDEVWYSNVPHTRLVEDKGGQNWIAIKGDKFIFPGGGTQFAHGADQYLDQMAKMVPEIAFGVRTRVALDVGCGVASWGAYLMSRGVLTLSIAPKDVHENQIQFALERGVPAMVAVLATQRLLYPSQAFDIIHCSRCRIEWTRDGGILLLEVDRLLRAGGFFAWAAQPVYKHEGNLPEEWQAMYNLTKHLCWTLVAKEGYLAIWQKPTNNSCYENRPVGSQPPVCNEDDDPDNIWYVPLTSCLMQPTEEKPYHSVPDWPARLHVPPDRLQDLELDAMTAKEEAFLADQRYWKEVVGGYLRGLGLKLDEVRNVMDMNAGYGGFAAAIVDSKADWWVMNIVPVSGPNTLPVIYDRGLIGVAHDWCESFDTYPRTYDLLHVSGLFTLEKNRCAKSHIIVEMDRILRPAGWVLVRDSVDIINEVEVLARAARWTTKVLDTESGPFGKDRLLLCKKPLWHT